jgi:hypothetical protein
VHEQHSASSFPVSDAATLGKTHRATIPEPLQPQQTSVGELQAKHFGSNLARARDSTGNQDDEFRGVHAHPTSHQVLPSGAQGTADVPVTMPTACTPSSWGTSGHSEEGTSRREPRGNLEEGTSGHSTEGNAAAGATALHEAFGDVPVADGSGLRSAENGPTLSQVHSVQHDQCEGSSDVPPAISPPLQPQHHVSDSVTPHSRSRALRAPQRGLVPTQLSMHAYQAMQVAGPQVGIPGSSEFTANSQELRLPTPLQARTEARHPQMQAAPLTTESQTVLSSMTELVHHQRHAARAVLQPLKIAGGGPSLPPTPSAEAPNAPEPSCIAPSPWELHRPPLDTRSHTLQSQGLSRPSGMVVDTHVLQPRIPDWQKPQGGEQTSAAQPAEVPTQPAKYLAPPILPRALGTHGPDSPGKSEQLLAHDAPRNSEQLLAHTCTTEISRIEALPHGHYDARQGPPLTYPSPADSAVQGIQGSCGAVSPEQTAVGASEITASNSDNAGAATIPKELLDPARYLPRPRAMKLYPYSPLSGPHACLTEPFAPSPPKHSPIKRSPPQRSSVIAGLTPEPPSRSAPATSPAIPAHDPVALERKLQREAEAGARMQKVLKASKVTRRLAAEVVADRLGFDSASGLTVPRKRREQRLEFQESSNEDINVSVGHRHGHRHATDRGWNASHGGQGGVGERTATGHRQAVRHARVLQMQKREMRREQHVGRRQSTAAAHRYERGDLERMSSMAERALLLEDSRSLQQQGGPGCLPLPPRHLVGSEGLWRSCSEHFAGVGRRYFSCMSRPNTHSWERLEHEAPLMTWSRRCTSADTRGTNSVTSSASCTSSGRLHDAEPQERAVASGHLRLERGRPSRQHAREPRHAVGEPRGVAAGPLFGNQARSVSPVGFGLGICPEVGVTGQASDAVGIMHRDRRVPPTVGRAPAPVDTQRSPSNTTRSHLQQTESSRVASSAHAPSRSALAGASQAPEAAPSLRMPGVTRSAELSACAPEASQGMQAEIQPAGEVATQSAARGRGGVGVVTAVGVQSVEINDRASTSAPVTTSCTGEPLAPTMQLLMEGSLVSSSAVKGKASCAGSLQGAPPPHPGACGTPSEQDHMPHDGAKISSNLVLDAQKVKPQMEPFDASFITHSGSIGSPNNDVPSKVAHNPTLVEKHHELGTSGGTGVLVPSKEGMLVRAARVSAAETCMESADLLRMGAAASRIAAAESFRMAAAEGAARAAQLKDTSTLAAPAAVQGKGSGGGGKLSKLRMLQSAANQHRRASRGTATRQPLSPRQSLSPRLQARALQKRRHVLAGLLEPFSFSTFYRSPQKQRGKTCGGALSKVGTHMVVDKAESPLQDLTYDDNQTVHAGSLGFFGSGAVNKIHDIAAAREKGGPLQATEVPPFSFGRSKMTLQDWPTPRGVRAAAFHHTHVIAPSSDSSACYTDSCCSSTESGGGVTHDAPSEERHPQPSWPLHGAEASQGQLLDMLLDHPRQSNGRTVHDIWEPPVGGGRRRSSSSCGLLRSTSDHCLGRHSKVS